MLLSYRICPGIWLRSFISNILKSIFFIIIIPLTSNIINTVYLSFKILSILRQDNFNFCLLQPQSIAFTLFTLRDLDAPSSQPPRFRIRVFTSHTSCKIYFIILPLAFVPAKLTILFSTTIALKIVCGKCRHMQMLLSYRICPGNGLCLLFQTCHTQSISSLSSTPLPSSSSTPNPCFADTV